jgi:glycosyltransferase involved in cell wall biosynthesis
LDKEKVRNIKILVLGQTPPPYHGQSIQIGEMLKGEYDGVELIHVRMNFSRTTGEIGRFRLKKILHLVEVILQALWKRWRFKARVLYYPPAGPNRIPILRDLVLLCLLRQFFRKTVFHFRAGGVSTVYDDLPFILKWFYEKAYFYPDVAIRLSPFTPNDGSFLKASEEYIVPNGITDHFIATGVHRVEKNIMRLLYVGRMIASKGIETLLKALDLLKSRGFICELVLVGEFESFAFRNQMYDLIHQLDLGKEVVFTGTLLGENKYSFYRQSDIFCFPSYFESETFGTVVLEAMQFSLPVVATRWRGVRSLVREGISGYLTPVKDSEAFAEKLEILIGNPDLRLKIGRAGREIYLREYTFDHFRKNMEKVFKSLGEN